MAGDLLYPFLNTLLQWGVGRPLFLPLPTAANDLLFIVAVSLGALAVLFGVHPTAILGVTYLVLVMYVVDVLGPHPLLAVMIIATAAIARLAGIGGTKLRAWTADAGPDTMAAVAGILHHLVSNRGDGREDD